MCIRDRNNGAPSFAGNVGVRYEGRKVGFGVEARMQSERRWMLLTLSLIHIYGAGAVTPLRPDLCRGRIARRLCRFGICLRPSGAGRGGSVHGGHGTAARSYHAAA